VFECVCIALDRRLKDVVYLSQRDPRKV
jgi:hypothetical protein